MLSRDVRFEGWTSEEWLRFVRLWRPRAAPGPDAERARGGIVAVYDDGRVVKLVHTVRGRLDPRGEETRPSNPPPASPPAMSSSRASGQPSVLPPTASTTGGLAKLSHAHDAAWALSMRLGALDEAMDRFGARAQRSDDLTTQSLRLLAIVREMITEGAMAIWPERLRGVPMPTPPVVHRALDALCTDGRTLAIGIFDAGDLWTCLVARRRQGLFDVIAGPGELRPALGLLSGDWRRDYRHLARAIEERYAPLSFGCFAELATFRSLLIDALPGDWSRAVAVRDVLFTPIPTAVGVALGWDSTRYALRGLRALTGRIAPLAAFAPRVGSARARIAQATGKDLSALLGFDPLATLRALLQR